MVFTEDANQCVLSNSLRLIDDLPEDEPTIWSGDSKEWGMGITQP